MQKLLIALFVIGAAAYMPASPGMLAQSKVAASAMPAAVARAPAASMSAVTEWDADGNPVTHFEMFDPLRAVIQLLPWITLLVLNPF